MPVSYDFVKRQLNDGVASSADKGQAMMAMPIKLIAENLMRKFVDLDDDALDFDSDNQADISELIRCCHMWRDAKLAKHRAH